MKYLIFNKVYFFNYIKLCKYRFIHLDIIKKYDKDLKNN